MLRASRAATAAPLAIALFGLLQAGPARAAPRDYQGPRAPGEAPTSTGTRGERGYSGVSSVRAPDQAPVVVDRRSQGTEVPQLPQLIGRGPDRGKLVFKPNRYLVIPGIVYAPGTGLSGSLRFRYVNRIRDARFNRVRFDLQARLSTKLVQKHTLKLELRDLLHKREVFDFNFQYIEDPVYPYRGIANYDDLSDVDEHDANFLSSLRTFGPELYYRHPVLRRHARHGNHEAILRVAGGIRYNIDLIEPGEGSLLEEQRPDDEGYTRRAGLLLGLSWDSRNDNTNPSSGNLAEATVEWASKYFGGTHDFGRVNLSATTYRPLHPKLTFVNKTVLDVLFGDVPLVPLGQVGGFDGRVEGIGSLDFGRGFARLRYIGRGKLATLTELRYQPVRFFIRRRSVDLGFKLFADVGKVFSKGDLGPFANLRVAGGLGTYVVWYEFFVFRLDVGFSRETWGAYASGGAHPF